MNVLALSYCLIAALGAGLGSEQEHPVIDIRAVSHATRTVSPKGTRLAVITKEDRSAVQVWDLNDRRLVETLYHPEIETWTAVGYSDDGSGLVAGSANGRVVVWDSKSFQVRSVVADQAARPVELIRLSRDRRTLFVEYQNAPRCVLWDVEAESRLASFEARGVPKKIILSPQGDWVTALYSQGVWHWHDGDASPTEPVLDVTVHHVAMSLNERLMSMVTHDGLEICRTSSPKRMPRPVRCDASARSRFVGEDTLLVMRQAEDDVNLETWRIPANPEDMEFVSAHNGVVAMELAASPDGSAVAVIGDNPAFVTVHRQEDTKPLVLGRELRELRDVDPHRNKGMEHAVRAIAFLDRGQRVVAAHANGVVRVWPLDDHSSPQQFASLPRPKHIWASPDQTALVVIDEDAAIQLIDLAATIDLAPRRRFAVIDRSKNEIYGRNVHIETFDVSADGRLAALTAKSPTSELRMLDLSQGRWSGHIPDFQPWGLGFSADGQRLFMISNKSFRLLDLPTGRQFETQPHHDRNYRGGERLIFCVWGGEEVLLNPVTGDITCYLKYSSLEHPAAFARTVSEDGKRMAIVADRQDNPGLGLEIFNTLDGATLASRPFDEKHLVALAFHPHQPRTLVVVNPMRILTYDYGRNEWTTVAELDRFSGNKELEDAISDPFSGLHGMGRLLEGVPLRNLGDNPVQCAAVSSLGIVAVGQLRSVTLWSLSSGKLLAELPQNNEEVVQSMRFSASGNVLCYAPEKGAFYAIDVSRLSDSARDRRPHEVAKPIEK